MKDLRSPLAKARDKFLDEVSDCQASTLGTIRPGYYLRNRIAAAFEAGAIWQEKHSQNEKTKNTTNEK